MKSKNEIIESQIGLLGGQRERLIRSFKEINFNEMNAVSKKIEFDMQINKIDIRIDFLIDKLIEKI